MSAGLQDLLLDGYGVGLALDIVAHDSLHLTEAQADLLNTAARRSETVAVWLCGMIPVNPMETALINNIKSYYRNDWGWGFKNAST